MYKLVQPGTCVQCTPKGTSTIAWRGEVAYVKRRADVSWLITIEPHGGCVNGLQGRLRSDSSEYSPPYGTFPSLKPFAFSFADEVCEAVLRLLPPPIVGPLRWWDGARFYSPGLQGVRATADFPTTTATPTEALVQPYEGVNEKDPEKKLKPHVGERARETVVWANTDLVVGHLEFDGDIVTIDGTDGRDDCFLQVRDVPAVYDLRECQ